MANSLQIVDAVVYAVAAFAFLISLRDRLAPSLVGSIAAGAIAGIQLISLF